MTKHDLSAFKKKPSKNLLNGAASSQDVATQKTEPATKKKGRRPKPVTERLTEKVTVNFTQAEFENLQKLSEQNFGVPLPTLIRGILKETKDI